MASGKCIRGIEIDFFRKETNMRLQSGGNSSPSVQALVQESPVSYFPYLPLLTNSKAVIQGSFKSMPVSCSGAMRNALQAGWNPINIRLGNSELLGADAEKFVIPQGFDLRFAGSNHGEGISHCIEDLQLVAWFLAGTSLVVFNNGRQIAATEIFLRQVIGERNAGEERVFHGLSGYKVMKRV